MDIISFYFIFNKEAARQFLDLNINRCSKETRKKYIDVEVLNTGSALKDLYLQYIKERSRLNAYGYHMIIRNNIIICVKVKQNISNAKHWVAEISKKEETTVENIFYRCEPYLFDTEVQNTFPKMSVL